MPIVATTIALAAAVWGAIYARRGSLVIGCGLVLVIGYVLGHEFWNSHIGPLPLTLDRLLLGGIVAALVLQWRCGRFSLRPLTVEDWLLALMLFTVVASAVLSGQSAVSDGVTSKWGRLLAGFLIPAVLYVVARQLPIIRRETALLMLGFTLLGLYLAVTAFMEVTGRWSLVFPRYIADPLRGIHFGRARGPELNAVSLGMTLTTCFWCTWLLANITVKRWQQLALLVALPLMAGAIYFTYTRSTWLGLAASGTLVAAIEIPRRWRLPTIAVATFAGLIVVATAWTNIVGLEREGSAQDAEHSVDQRKSFAYVSWQMFQDHPVFGVGFGRFYDRKLAYLSDRSQRIELDSIRGLHHHNTFLSLLTEMGVVGLTAFIAMLAVWARCAWRIVRDQNLSRWQRSIGILMVALLANYLASALFHDLTLLPSQHLSLFAFAGFAANLQHQKMPGLSFDKVASFWGGWCLKQAHGSVQVNSGSTAQSTSVKLFGMQIENITLTGAVDRVLDWCRSPREACRYIVTPNVDHAVLFQHRTDLQAAYSEASLVVADGAPLILASRLLRRPLPERIAGSDLVPALFANATTPLRVFLLGAAPGVAEAAARRIEQEWRNVTVVGTYSPPLGFERDQAENARILEIVAESQPDLLIVGFGAPKQELWVHEHQAELQAKVAICAGATIDFLAGNRRRSPVWMRRAGLEWLHRVCSEPRRLAARYARDAWVFPQLLWREWHLQAMKSD
jgi:N-acetylglucosaminyldiphosphoundecaprenol N-acetyl-beta-D-mannosaminyltransferase